MSLRKYALFRRRAAREPPTDTPCDSGVGEPVGFRIGSNSLSESAPMYSAIPGMCQRQIGRRLYGRQHNIFRCRTGSVHESMHSVLRSDIPRRRHISGTGMSILPSCRNSGGVQSGIHGQSCCAAPACSIAYGNWCRRVFFRPAHTHIGGCSWQMNNAVARL